MNKLKERVRWMLKNYPETKKSDDRLMLYIWRDDYTKLMQGKPRMGDVTSFFAVLGSSMLTNWESVTRVRRELQRKYPELRDKETYEKRHKAAADYRDRYSSRYNFEGRR
mgnify:CR=1 FL=1|tara:strand:+ start:2559 stop:2888 length:330 start_codon:yes stop_codon:yes gene_type:complete